MIRIFYLFKGNEDYNHFLFTILEKFSFNPLPKISRNKTGSVLENNCTHFPGTPPAPAPAINCTAQNYLQTFLFYLVAPLLEKII